MRNIMILSAAALLIILTGCASQPLFPTNGSQALKSESEFGVLTAQPDVFQGQAIKLAGRIVGVETTVEGTMVTAEWLPYPDAEYAGPTEIAARSPGRFVIFYPGTLDPEGRMYGNKFLVLGKQGEFQAKSAFRSSSQSLAYIAARCLHVWKTGDNELEAQEYSEYSYPVEETYCSNI